MADRFQLKALITGVDRLSPTLRRMQRNLQGFRRTLRNSASGAMPLAAGLTAGLAGTSIAFARQEDAATGLKVAMMDASAAVGPEFEKISKLATGLGNKLPGTTADFQNMMQMLVRQGIPAGNILTGVGEASAYLAVQLKKTPEAAAEFAAKMQDATGTASNDMMGLFDTIQRAFYMGVDDTNMLSFFSKTSSVMKMVSQDGLTAAKALAPVSVMMDQLGMQGESAGNAVRKVIQAGLDKKKMRGANKLLRKQGIKLDFTDGKGEYGGLDNLFAQLKKLKKLTSVESGSVIKQIFGDDNEVLSVVNALIIKGKEGYDDILQRMNKQASLQQRVTAQLGTLTSLWDAMAGTAVNGLAAMGGAFAGDIKEMVAWSGALAERFSAFAAAYPGVIRGVVGLAAGFVIMKLGLLGVNIALGLVSQTMMLSPLGIFLRLLALGAGLILANWGTFGPWFKTMWHSVTGWFSEAWEFIKECSASGWQYVKDLFSGFHPLESITEHWEPIVAWFKAMWQRVSVYIEPLLDAMKKVKGWANDSWDYVFGEDNPEGAQRYGGPLLSQSDPSLLSYKSQQEVKGEMVVKFENAPPGMSVVKTQSAQPGFGLGYDVGYNRYAYPK